MPLAQLYSRANIGIKAPLVTVEADLSRGLPKFTIVGLPETVVKESKDRVQSAIANSKFEFPLGRITVNLAPADLRKEGCRFDLAIALAILAISKQIPLELLNQYEFAGELSLAGELRAIPGALPMSVAAKRDGRTLLLPNESAKEAALVPGIKIIPACSLIDVVAFLNGQTQLKFLTTKQSEIHSTKYKKDMAEVKGQSLARRALEIAAAGNHSLLMLGSPGTGKTMLAERLPSILPELDVDEALEVAALKSISHKAQIDLKLWRQKPFRAPHHSSSAVSLVGGGSNPRPGEISLAHHGVLFLDELPEFDRKVLEVLREPLESGQITIARAARSIDFPAKFQLIAAMNPCPCGYFSDPLHECLCTKPQIERYRNKISGPLLDRIDMHIEVPPLDKGTLSATNYTCEDSATIRARVLRARAQQAKRKSLNCFLTGKKLENACMVSREDTAILENALEKFGLSARSYHRILKVARTIADLANAKKVEKVHLLEALSFRRLDRRRTI